MRSRTGTTIVLGLVVFPLLAVPLSFARPRTWIGWTIAGLLLAPSLLVAVIFVAAPATMYNHPTGSGTLWQALAASGLPDLSPYLPSFVAPRPNGPILMTLWIILLGVVPTIVALDAPIAKRRRE